MRYLYLVYALVLSTSFILAQDSCLIKAYEWITNKGISLRHSYDGSQNENKPASFSFKKDHISEIDIINVDAALKISGIEIIKNSPQSIFIYPKVEWHRSTDSSDLKNKLKGGINLEIIPFLMKSPNIKKRNQKGLKVVPWIQGTSSFKRNFIEDVFEIKLAGQLSFESNYKFMPGYQFRDTITRDLIGFYYPYFGIEYNKLPNLDNKGETEEFVALFYRLYLEIWIISQILQWSVDGIFRYNTNHNSNLNKSLPLFVSSLNLYPGKQQSVGIGYEFRIGYDSSSKYQKIQISAIKANAKF